jgi:hypothetical protein
MFAAQCQPHPRVLGIGLAFGGAMPAAIGWSST